MNEVLEISLTIGLVVGSLALVHKVASEPGESSRAESTYEGLYVLMLGAVLMIIGTLDLSMERGPGTGWALFALGTGVAAAIFGIARLTRPR